jgi:four helix bundle protein
MAKTNTFRIYEVALRLVRLMRVLADKVGRHSREMRKQMMTAVTSVAANIAEGQNRRGAHGTERFDTAMGSARECKAWLEIAIAAGYLTQLECDEAIDYADRIAATLWRCTHR